MGWGSDRSERHPTEFLYQRHVLRVEGSSPLAEPLAVSDRDAHCNAICLPVAQRIAYRHRHRVAVANAVALAIRDADSKRNAICNAKQQPTPVRSVGRSLRAQ